MLYDNENVYYLPVIGEGFKFSTDITKYIFTGDSIIVAAIQIAFYMGMKEIYLYGIDHNFNYSIEGGGAYEVAWLRSIFLIF